MRYCGEADVDGSRRPWTEVVFHQRKLYCGPLTEVVSYATPPHFVKIKINFHEAQKLTWKEIKCLYGLIKIITPNHICELLRNFNTRCDHTEEHQKQPLLYYCAFPRELFTIQSNHSGQNSLTKIYFRAPIFRSGLKARSNKKSNANSVSKGLFYYAK